MEKDNIVILEEWVKENYRKHPEKFKDLLRKKIEDLIVISDPPVTCEKIDKLMNEMENFK